jgi:predicted amino acid-binding ACT domain protein
MTDDPLTIFLVVVTLGTIVYGLLMKLKPRFAEVQELVEEAMEDGLTLDEVMEIADEVADVAEEVAEAVEEAKEEAKVVVSMSEGELTKMLKKDLIVLAEEHGIRTDGLKKDLVERLAAHLTE